MTRPRIDWKGRCRRVSPIAVHPSEDRLTDPTAAVQPPWHELAFMPEAV